MGRQPSKEKQPTETSSKITAVKVRFVWQLKANTSRFNLIKEKVKNTIFRAMGREDGVNSCNLYSPENDNIGRSAGYRNTVENIKVWMRILAVVIFFNLKIEVA